MRRGMLVLMLVAVGLGGCGKSDAQRAVEDLRQEAEYGLEPGDYTEYCDNFSKRLLKRVHGSRKRCLKNGKNLLASREAFGAFPDVKIIDAKTNGRRGRVALKYSYGGGTFRAHARYVLTADGFWALDEYEPDFIRGALTSQNKLGQVVKLLPVLKEPPVQMCFTRRYSHMDVGALTNFFHRLEGAWHDGYRQSAKDFNACVPEKDGVSGMRQSFEVGYKLAADRQGIDKQVTACVMKRTRVLSEREIADLALIKDEDDPLLKKTLRAISAAQKSCSGGVS